MNIKRIKTEKLHGYISKEILFHNDISLLVGINGSGKTSILNLLNWIITPSIPMLCITEFKSVLLDFSYKNIECTVLCKHTKGRFVYKLTTNEGKNYAPLIVSIHKTPKELSEDEVDRNRFLEHYSSLRPDKNEETTWRFLMSLPSPTVIGLDRNLFTDEAVVVERNVNDRVNFMVKKSTEPPIYKVKSIVNTEYSKAKNSVLKLTNDLKNYLVLSAFDGNITDEDLVEDKKTNCQSMK